MRQRPPARLATGLAPPPSGSYIRHGVVHSPPSRSMIWVITTAGLASRLLGGAPPLPDHPKGASGTPAG
eukprot:14833453-Alexandrium_andersonii.AAC.1